MIEREGIINFAEASFTITFECINSTIWNYCSLSSSWLVLYLVDAGLQQGGDLGVVEVKGNIEGRVALNAHQGVGPGLKQKAHDFCVASIGSHPEGSGTVIHCQINLCMVLKEQRYHFCVAVPGSHVERSGAVIHCQINLRLILKNQRHHFCVAILVSDVEESRAVLICQIDLCVVLKEQRHQF